MSKKVLLLNSACGKYPRGRDPWVRATVAALDTLASRGDISLVSSLGLPSWELTTFLAGKLGTRLDLIVPGSEFEVPGSEEYNRLLEDFGLDGRKTVFHFTGAGSPGERMAGRDRMAFELAGEVCLVSIRPRGRLERLICEHEGCARLEFCDEFRIEWQDTQWRPRYDFEGRTLNPELSSFGPGRLIHWTHSTAGPWPDERPRRFYRDMLAAPDDYVRSAEATLVRIVREGILKGSSWKMPGGRSAVSLTALSPAESVPLMRWRKRYLRYSLEPFGLAFRTEAIKRLGAGPVHYFDPDLRPREGSDRLYYQSAGRIGDWTVEREWRLEGDLSLDAFSPQDLVLITADPVQAGWMEKELNPRWRVMPLFMESL